MEEVKQFLILKIKKKTPELYQSYAEAVEFLKGDYLTAGDINTFKEDLVECSKVTNYVYGINVETSAPTSKGLFNAIKTTNKFISENDFIKNLHIAISGVGKVGSKLAKLLYKAGAKITASSIEFELISKLNDGDKNHLRYNKLNDVFLSSLAKLIKDSKNMTQLDIQTIPSYILKFYINHNHYMLRYY